MKKKKLDWLDCSLFVMIAIAESTDKYLTEEEIHTIIDKAQGLTAEFNTEGDSYDGDAIMEKFNAAFERYNEIGETAPEGKMNAYLMKEVFKLTAHMKRQRWFSNKFGQAFVNDLVHIADADGEIIRNEQQLINRVAEGWGVTLPFH